MPLRYGRHGNSSALYAEMKFSTTDQSWPSMAPAGLANHNTDPQDKSSKVTAAPTQDVWSILISATIAENLEASWAIDHLLSPKPIRPYPRLFHSFEKSNLTKLRRRRHEAAPIPESE